MKKIQTVFLIIFILISVFFIGIYIFIKCFDINKFLPQISSSLTQAIHRKVNISQGSLDFSFTNGLSLILEELKVGNELPSKTDILTIKKVSLQLDPIAIISKKIDISNIKLIDLVVLMDDPIKIRIPIDEVDIKINNFSLKDPFDVVSTIKVLSNDSHNIQARWHSSLDLNNSSFFISDLIISSDLKQLNMNKVRMTTPLLESVPIWPSDIKGNLLIEIPALKTTSKGLEGKLEIKIALKDGYVAFRDFLNPINNISLVAETDLNYFRIKSLDGYIGTTGSIGLDGQINDISHVPQFAFNITAKNIEIDELINQKAWPIQVKGAISSSFKVNGQSFDPDVMKKDIKAIGRLELVNGKIEKFNVLKSILSSVNFVPGLSDRIQNSLSAELKENIGGESTVLDKVQAEVNVHDEVVFIENGLIESKIFAILFQGSVDFNLNLLMLIKTSLSFDLSEAMVKTIKPLNSLLNDQNQIYIPGKIEGKIPNITYKPQIDYIVQKVAISEGAQQLDKILDKNPKVKNIINAVLGGNENQSNGDQPSSENSQNQPQDESAKKLINNVLNKILK